MKQTIINILIFAPAIICVFYVICRYLNFSTVIDPEEQDCDIDDTDFEAEVEALMASRRNEEQGIKN